MASNGQRQLLWVVLHRTSAREVAARCRVHPAQVTRWATGETIPGPDARAKLREIYGIREEDWHVSPEPHAG